MKIDSWRSEDGENENLQRKIFSSVAGTDVQAVNSKYMLHVCMLTHLWYMQHLTYVRCTRYVPLTLIFYAWYMIHDTGYRIHDTWNKINHRDRSRFGRSQANHRRHDGIKIRDHGWSRRFHRGPPPPDIPVLHAGLFLTVKSKYHSHRIRRVPTIVFTIIYYLYVPSDYEYIQPSVSCTCDLILPGWAGMPQGIYTATEQSRGIFKSILPPLLSLPPGPFSSRHDRDHVMIQDNLERTNKSSSFDYLFFSSSSSSSIFIFIFVFVFVFSLSKMHLYFHQARHCMKSMLSVSKDSPMRRKRSMSSSSSRHEVWFSFYKWTVYKSWLL